MLHGFLPMPFPRSTTIFIFALTLETIKLDAKTFNIAANDYVYLSKQFTIHKKTLVRLQTSENSNVKIRE